MKAIPRNALGLLPFVRIIIPAVAGLALGFAIHVPAYVSALCFLLAFVPAVVLRQKPYGGIYLYATIILFFFASVQFNRNTGQLPYGERIVVAAEITEKPSTSGRWQRTTAKVGYYRRAGDTEWIRANERIMLSIDTVYCDIGAGTHLIFRGWINRIDTTGCSYGNLMALRGMFGRMYLVPGNMVLKAPYVAVTPASVSARLQERAIRKLERLAMPEERLAVVTAMVAGDKRGIDPEVRAGYSATGTAHLLAVSGLHVGIVFILINLFSFWLPMAPRGHIIRNLVAIALIWIYTFMTGLSPSAVRAAFMFSFAQGALATNSYRNGLNIMFGSAVLMLAVNPNHAGDPSFLLSYSAVLAIFMFFPPLYRLCRTRFKALNALVSVLLIGLTATVGTAPLVSYWFGNLPIVGLLINPAVSVTAHIIVMIGVLWVVMPFGIGIALFSKLLSFAAGIQNSVIAWSSGFGWASIPLSMPLWSVLCIYCLYICSAIFLYLRPAERD